MLISNTCIYVFTSSHIRVRYATLIFFLQIDKYPKRYFHNKGQGLWLHKFIDTFRRCTTLEGQGYAVRDSSVLRRLFVRLAGAVGRQSALHIRKTADLPLQLGVGTFPRFVAIGFYFYLKPLYKSLHQSFCYSFITILPSESGATLDYCTIFRQTLSIRHFTFTFKHLSRDFEKTTITAMYHVR